MNEIAINKYKIGHTIPKIYPGGDQGARFNDLYHVFIYISEYIFYMANISKISDMMVEKEKIAEK
tara:strand:+ start:633 stop:827 length:195 start_codon:yes stop_codon:yes gene_type:complete